MLAMQYTLPLPADYDIGIIDRRIRDKGRLMDGFPKLAFKAYLRAEKGDLGSPDSLYAPFYLWDQEAGATDFLCGDGLSAIIRDFGWPTVKTWIVWAAVVGPDVASATYAAREIRPIDPHTDLKALRRSAEADVITGEALASLTGYDPSGWTRVTFRLYDREPDQLPGRQIYRVGHVATGG